MNGTLAMLFLTYSLHPIQIRETTRSFAAPFSWHLEPVSKVMELSQALILRSAEMRVSKDEGVSSAHWKSSFETGSASPPQDEGELLKQVLMQFSTMATAAAKAASTSSLVVSSTMASGAAFKGAATRLASRSSRLRISSTTAA